MRHVMGANVGFRIEAYKGDTVLGTLVVRVNGKWVDAQAGVGRNPAAHG